jgi:heme/copper-type cytochrome/quinol oxidase subunit 2
MFILNTLAVIYSIIALFALLMTYDEQQKINMKGAVIKTLSFIACLFWPVIVLFAIFMMQRAR